MLEDRRYWDPVNETMSEDELQAVRWKKLERQLRYCYDRSEFYRAKLDAAGARPGDVRSWADFRRIPCLITKAEHQASQEESRRTAGHPFGTILCAPPEQVVSIFTTSGSTGQPTFYLFTANDLGIYNEIVSREYWRAGVRPRDVVLGAFGLSMWVALQHMLAVRHFGAALALVGAEAGADRILRTADLIRPTVLSCTPSLAEHLIERAPEAIGKEVSALGIRTLICGAEPGAGLPEVRRKLEGAYGATLYNTMGPAYFFAYVSCPASPETMHDISADHCVWTDDLVDPTTKEPLEITDGVVGEGYITDLDREAAPPLKYGYGDVLQVFTSPCACGMPGKRIKILGRADDMLIVKGVNVYPAAIKNVVASFVPRASGHLRIVLTGPPPRVQPPLRLRVELGEPLGPDAQRALAREIETRCREVLRVSPVIELIPPGTLPRSHLKTQLLEKAYLAEGPTP